MVASVEIGVQTPQGPARQFLLSLAFEWSAFQFCITSCILFFHSKHLSFNLVFNHEARQYPLIFALILAMLTYPLFKSSPRDKTPLTDQTWLR